MSSSRFRRIATSARLRAALSLGVVTAVGATGTFAYWTDDVVVSGTTFTSGSIDLKVDGADSVGATGLTMTNMVPGSTVAGTLSVSNTGTAALKYSAATVASNPALANALVVKVTNTLSGGACTGAALAGSGTTLSGALLSTKRQLNGAQSETICIQVTLPSTVNDPTLQGQTSNVTFTFAGTSDLS